MIGFVGAAYALCAYGLRAAAIAYAAATPFLWADEKCVFASLSAFVKYEPVLELRGKP